MMMIIKMLDEEAIDEEAIDREMRIRRQRDSVREGGGYMRGSNNSDQIQCL